MKRSLYSLLTERKNKQQKSFAVLIDPDKAPIAVLDELIALGAAAAEEAVPAAAPNARPEAAADS